MTDISTIMGSFIEKTRIEKKLSQSELAKRSRVSRATLIKLESAEGSNLTINNVYKLFEVLGTNFSEFEVFLRSNLLSGNAGKLESSELSNEDKEKLKAMIYE